MILPTLWHSLLQCHSCRGFFVLILSSPYFSPCRFHRLQGFFRMKEFAESFYKSKQWQQCRAAFMQSRRGLCEKCLKRGVYKAGVIVHHKKHVTPDTINDPAVLYGFDNLQLLCRDCHAEEHKSKRRYKVLPDGRVIGTT